VLCGLGQPPPLADDGIAIIRATNIFRGRIVATTSFGRTFKTYRSIEPRY
jgi:hypothetical protein